MERQHPNLEIIAPKKRKSDIERRYKVELGELNAESHLIDIFSLTNEEKEKLKEEAKNWDKTGWVLVHPMQNYGLEGKNNYYTQGASPEASESQIKYEKMLELIKKVLAENPRPPVLLFEEHWKNDEGITENIIGQVNKGDVYLVPTCLGSPDPFRPEFVKESSVMGYDFDGAWQKLAGILKDLGFETFLVDGLNLNLYGSEYRDKSGNKTGESHWLMCCVKGAVDGLKDRGFNAFIGNNTLPASREDIKKSVSSDDLGIEEIRNYVKGL